MDLYLHRHVYTHVDVFFITMYICVHAYVPYPALHPTLLVWGLNRGPPVWLAGAVSLVSVPRPHFFLSYTGKHEELQAPILTGGCY